MFTLANDTWFCRHCRRRPRAEPHGLCFHCHCDPAVRNRYAQRLLRPGAASSPRPLWDRPTTHRYRTDEHHAIR